MVGRWIAFTPVVQYEPFLDALFLNQHDRVMAKPLFTQQNTNAEIARLKALPECERREVADAIEEDIRAWLLQTFTLPRSYETRLAMWPQSMREETGFGIGTAFLHKEWTLKIVMPDNPEPEPNRATEHEQSVSGSANPQTGAYTVTKTHKWTW
jgi:hypothetical protein